MTQRTIRGSEEQGATFVELFFDLVFVFAVTQVTSVLAHDLTASGLLEALIVFWLVWWAWTQFTWSLNEADTDHTFIRLLTLVATALAFVMAMTVPEVTGENGWLFPLSYLILRTVGISLQWLLASGDQQWTGAVRRWTIVSSLGLVAVAAAVFVAPDLRFTVLGVAALLDVGAALQAATTGEWRLFSGHFAERHGLFVIIALGESLIAAGVGASEQPLTGGVLAVAAAAVVATCGLWWTYFGWAKDAMEERLAVQPPSTLGRFARDVYSFSHFPIIAGVIGLAVAVEEGIAHPGDELPLTGAVALVAGVTLFLGATGLALYLAGVRLPLIRVVGIGLLVAAIPVFAAVSAWMAIASVAVIVVVLAILEKAQPTRARPA